MNHPKVTVAIPTYNRANFLKRSIASVLAQTIADLELLVVDNTSTDHTYDIVSTFRDARIRYVRNAEHLAMIDNWSRAAVLAHGEYLSILGDDDELHPEFLARSVETLDAFPGVGFTYCNCSKVDLIGNLIQLWGYEFAPPGYLSGIDYLRFSLKYGCCLTNSSTVLLRRTAFDSVGGFRAGCARNTFDFNTWIRMALSYDVYFISDNLVDYTIHTEQISEVHWRTPSAPTGPLGTILELVDAVGMLLAGDMGIGSDFRVELSEALLRLNAHAATLIKQCLPDI